MFGRLAPGMQPPQATAEIAALMSRVAATSPATHQHLRPVVFPYGGARDVDGGSWIDFAITHGPVLLVLIVACANVGTLVYARTATREAEIAMRHALGASRARIVGQLFVEALVLAAVAAVVGLLSRTWCCGGCSRTWRRGSGLPFWIRPGLKFATVIYAALLAVVAAGILGALPAIKATGSVAPQLGTSGVGGATLRFGKVWTTAMIAQVALTVICIVPATEVSEEALRDRLVRRRFPAAQYLAVEIAIDRDAPTRDDKASASASAHRVEQFYGELERRLAQEPGVLAIAFGDRLPGMGAPVRRAEVEVSPGADPVPVPNLWIAAVRPGLLRDVRPADSVGSRLSRRRPRARRAQRRSSMRRSRDAIRKAAVPSADACGTSSPTGRNQSPARNRWDGPRHRHDADRFRRGAVYVSRRVAATASALVMGVRLAGDPSALAPRVREIAAAIDPNVRLGIVQALDEVVWSYDAPQLAASAGVAGVVSLGLFLSAASIFSLMSVSVTRRTREIGLRAALGASHGRLLAEIFSRALVLIGSGIVAGDSVVVLFATSLEDVSPRWVVSELLITSTVMLIVGLLGCIEPARRALRINPTEALKEA